MKNRLAHLLLFVTLLTTACGQLPGDYMLTRKPPTSGALLPKYFTPVTGQYLTFDSNLLPVMAVPSTNLSSVTGTLAVANGGTGSTSASAARTALGLAIGSDVQAYNANTSLLGSSISLTTEVTDTLPVANGGTGATSTSAARTALGLAIGSDVQAYNANTSLLGSSISLTTEVTGTLPVANGGTGGTTAAAARAALLPSFAGNAGKALVVNAGSSDVEFATVSGGGGSTLVRGSGVLQGYTVAPIVAEPPPALTVSFDSSDAQFTITLNGVTQPVVVDDFDPTSVVWVDNGSGDPSTTAYNFEMAFATFASTYGFTLSRTDNVVTIFTGATGSTSTSYYNLTAFTGVVLAGGGAGVNAVAGSGQVSEVTIISQDGTKTIKPLRCGVSGAGISTTVQFALKVGGIYCPLSADMASDATTGEPGVSSYFAELVSGRASASLVARMTGGVPNGGSLTCWAIAEQN